MPPPIILRGAYRANPDWFIDADWFSGTDWELEKGKRPSLVADKIRAAYAPAIPPDQVSQEEIDATNRVLGRTIGCFDYFRSAPRHSDVQNYLSKIDAAASRLHELIAGGSSTRDHDDLTRRHAIKEIEKAGDWREPSEATPAERMIREIDRLKAGIGEAMESAWTTPKLNAEHLRVLLSGIKESIFLPRHLSCSFSTDAHQQRTSLLATVCFELSKLLHPHQRPRRIEILNDHVGELHSEWVELMVEGLIQDTPDLSKKEAEKLVRKRLRGD